TTQAIIEAGHPVPISLEHGIEAGHRGDTTADRRPYGMIKKVWYDAAAGAVYAMKEWTALGADLVGSAMTKDGKSAWRISPRVKFGHAYHPETGETLGKAYMDVISLVTLPRQNSMEAVPLSRDAGEPEVVNVTKITEPFENDTTVNLNVFKLDSGEVGNNIERAPMQTQVDFEEAAAPEQVVDDNPQETEMARRKAAEPVEQEEITILLARGSDEARKLYEAAGVEADAEVEELTRVINENRENLAEALVELSRFKAEEAERKFALRQREVDDFIAGFEFANDGERDLYRAAMLSDDEERVEMARKALTDREAPDHDATINEAINEAKGRGAVAADFDLNDEAKELARQNPELAVVLLSQIPAGMVVRTGEPAGSDAAGLNDSAEPMNRDAAANELSRIAREKRNNGEFENMAQAIQAARAERPDLGLIVYPQQEK
ncbi:MAG: hypothetical protein VX160_07700, partial [Actinomycetota bacterium]|nr:hypothetical protein [Actinomycetota bacterium]